MRHIIYLVVPFLLLSSCHNQQKADLILHNARIFTIDKAFTVAEALAVKDGKILAVGNEEDILKGFTAANIINVQGNVVYPGFIDAHAHFVGYGRSLFEVNLYDCKNWDEAVE